MPGQVQETKNTATGEASMTPTFRGAVTVGNFLGGTMKTATTAGATVSDNVNAGNYSVGDNHATTNTSNDAGIWYKENTAAGTPTVTLTPGSAGDMGCCIEEYSGVLTASSLDQHGDSDANGTSIASVSLTNTGANGNLCIATHGSATQNVTVSNSTSGWTVDQNNTPNATQDAIVASRVQIPAAAFTTTFSVTGAAQDMTIAVASFKLAATGGPPPYREPFPRISGLGVG